MLKYSININEISGSTINIPMSNMFSTEVRQYDRIEKHFDVDDLNIVNPIVDLEKVKISPVDYSTKQNEFSEINFELNFFVNNDWTISGSKLSDVGFVEEDVKYSRQVLKNTFIRLSFYDSNDIKTQNLLYYSTIFFDAGKMYGQYIMDGDIDNIKTNLQVNSPKLSGGIGYFEGYNLYLFKNDIPKIGTTVYLKLEYNNAINGRTLLFTHNKPTTTDGYKLSELKNNMFLPITINYNEISNKYTYSITGYNTQTLNLTYYQAKVQ